MELFDTRFNNKSTITISGPSQSGKTTLVEKIVQLREHLFKDPIQHVQWFCAYPPTTKLDGVTYSIGIPHNILQTIEPHSLVIVDDFMKELTNSNELTSMMTKAVHHLPMTLIYITQNLFQKGTDTKTRRMNTNYLILFKNPHDKAQVDYIGRQMYPKDKLFLSTVFDDATRKIPYSYILIDCQQATPDEIRIRTNITESPMKVYIPLSMSINI